jgi:hypothetical protein
VQIIPLIAAVSDSHLDEAKDGEGGKGVQVGIVEASSGVWWIVGAAGTRLNYFTIKF